MRLFVAVWPPPQVRRLLADLPRPSHPRLRWTTEDQWHVTLSFIGDVSPSDVEPVTAALRKAARQVLSSPLVALGPETVRLGSGVLCLPASGLDPAASAVQEALQAIAPRAETSSAGTHRKEEPFRGHLTLARARSRAKVPGSLTGTPFEAEWPVEELCLVASKLDPKGARYQTVAREALDRGSA